MSGRRGESDQDEGGPDAGVMRAEEAVRQGLLGGLRVSPFPFGGH